MATTILQAFNEFTNNLEITDRQVNLVSSRRANVIKAIKEKISLHPQESYLIGSYDRQTLIRYLSEGDIDVMVIMHYGNNKNWDNPDGIVDCLNTFKNILDLAFPNTDKRRDRNCISMKFSEFSLDVVPAFSVNDGSFKIPDSVRKTWVATNPIKFAESMTLINISMGDNFKPLIKMVKAWNRNVGFPLRSFHLECIMHNHYKNYIQGYTYPSMLKVFFESLPSYVNSPIYDPITNDRLDEYLDNLAFKTLRQIAYEKSVAVASASKEAFEDQDKYVSVSIKEWKSILGEFFPSYG